MFSADARSELRVQVFSPGVGCVCLQCPSLGVGVKKASMPFQGCPDELCLSSNSFSEAEAEPRASLSCRADGSGRGKRAFSCALGKSPTLPLYPQLLNCLSTKDKGQIKDSLCGKTVWHTVPSNFGTPRGSSYETL